MNGDDDGGSGAHFDRGFRFANDPDHAYQSKYFGVSPCRDRWRGELTVDGVHHSIYHPAGGAFDTEEEAHLAVEAHKVPLGWKPAAKAAKQSGMKGVRWHKQCEKWIAKVDGALANRLNGSKVKYLGSFDDVEEAKRTLTAWIAARENGEVLPPPPPGPAPAVADLPSIVVKRDGLLELVPTLEVHFGMFGDAEICFLSTNGKPTVTKESSF